MRAFNTASAILPLSTIGLADPGLLNHMHISSTDLPASHLVDYAEGSSNDDELLVAGWLEKLLKHFGLHELDNSSERKLVELLERCGECNPSAFQNRALLLDLKRKIVRTAGAHLDSVFVSMSLDVVDEADAEPVLLAVENRQFEGLRYQGEVYRLIDSFLPRHRLQAFCLGQTLSEQKTAFMITQSSERFAVWVNVRAFPHRHHLSSVQCPSESRPIKK